MNMYSPQSDQGVGAGSPPPFNPAAPVLDASGQQLDQFSNATAWTSWLSWSNTIAQPGLISAWQSIASQMTAGPALDQLNSVINQLTVGAVNNAPIAATMPATLGDIYSTLINGAQTSNPPDAQALAQLSQEILNQEPGWSSLLWVNWISGSTTLVVQVRSIYTLNMTLSETPWWTHWDTFYDAASQIIAQVYLMEMANRPQTAFDPNSSPGMTASTDGLTATRTQVTEEFTSAAASALSTPSPAAGQVYAEIKIHQLAPGNIGVGIASSSLDVTDVNVAYVGGPGSIGLYDDGEVVTNNTSFATGPTFLDAEIIGVALDCTAQTVAFRNVTQSGAWSAAFSIAALGPAPFRLAITVYAVGESCTGNFAGLFVGAVPPGFGPWN